MTEVQRRITQAILEYGNGPIVRNGFAPFTDLLRVFASQRNIAAFAEACSLMFSSSLPNQWQIREEAPKILLNHYLPEVLQPQHLSWDGLITNASSWNAQLADVLDRPADLQNLLDAIVAEVEQSASPC